MSKTVLRIEDLHDIPAIAPRRDRKRWRLQYALFVLSLCVGLMSFHYWITRYRVPDWRPLKWLRVTEEVVRVNVPGPDFGFAVLGDISSLYLDEAPATILRDAQRDDPLFLCNMGDVVRFAKPKDWHEYISFLEQNLEPGLPYFHAPGNHDIDHNVFGKNRGFFKQHFGRLYYAVDAGDWRLIVLDSSGAELPEKQLDWLRRMLDEGARAGKRAILMMHAPPRKEKTDGYEDRAGETRHALGVVSTRALQELVKKYDVAAVFAGHLNTTIQYDWNGTPVNDTGLDRSKTWITEPACYYRVDVKGRELTVKTVSFQREGAEPTVSID